MYNLLITKCNQADLVKIVCDAILNLCPPPKIHDFISNKCVDITALSDVHLRALRSGPS